MLTKRRQGGIALITALFALMLLTGMGLGLLYMTDSETAVNSNYRSSEVAFYAAQAGMEEARDRMRSTFGANALVLPTVMPTAGGGVLYVVNPAGAEVVQPWNTANAYFDDHLCHEGYPGLGLADPGQGIACGVSPGGAGWYATANSVAPGTGTPDAISYKWVRVALKSNGTAAPFYVNGSNNAATLGAQVCWNGQNEQLLAGAATCSAMCPTCKPVYALTSLAVTQTGARRMLQGEYTQLQLPPLPSALTFDGPNASYSAPNSSNFVVNGTDQRSCGGNIAAPLPAVGGTDGPSVTTIDSAIPNNRNNNYTGSGGSTPDVENVNSTLDPTWQSPQKMQELISVITNASNNVYTGSQTNIDLGSSANPQITVVKGDLTMTGTTTGAGLLLVTGTLTMSGNSSYNGLILVLGQGVFISSGGGSGSFNGALLIAKIYDSSGNLLPSNGSPIVSWAGGGGNGIKYDSCWTNNLPNGFYYTRLSFHDVLEQ